MTTVVRLLGSPSIDAAGPLPPAPRARKSWALLAYLVLSRRPPSRLHLATLICPDADDPLGALRWHLADLRRSLGPWADISGDPVVLDLAADVTTDVALVLDGAVTPSDWMLLEGLSFAGCPGLETWLLVERRRLAGACEALLHEDSLRNLGSGRFDAAVDAARRLVGMNPLDENNQALFVRSLTSAGHRDAALEHARQCEELFQRELGVSPSPAVREAADLGVIRSPMVGRAAALAQLEAGQAAVNAGAIDAGLECLRRAVADASACGDEALRVTTLNALGGALVHGVRGRDEEGAAVFHEALALAQAISDQGGAARASRELGFIDVQAGRRQRAEFWLAQAEGLSTGDELAAVLGVRGMNLSDNAQYSAASRTLQRSVDLALSTGARRQASWSLSLLGRVHLLRGESADAEAALNHSIELVRAEQWMAFAPWPQSLHAELDRVQGRTAAATHGYDHAFALACQLGDPCWEGVAARGTAMVKADAGDIPVAMQWLHDASIRCTRWPDTYQWIHAYVLDAACDVAVAAGHPSAEGWVERLTTVAARGSMTELIVRSFVHRAHLGQPGAAAAAAQAAAAVDNPLVTDLVESL